MKVWRDIKLYLPKCINCYVSLEKTHTLKKFWRYNKASLGKVVPLEILVVSRRFNSGSLADIFQWSVQEFDKMVK